MRFSCLFCVSIIASGIVAACSHLLQKRQDNSDTCNDVLTREICTNGYYEDYAYVVAQCGQYSTARSFQDACRSNSMGTICGSIDFDSERVNDVCGRSSTTCSPECSDLLTATREEFGCCVNIYNSSFYYPESQAFRYSLWSLCGVEPVTEVCGPAPFQLPTGRDFTCNQSNFLNRLYFHVLCRPEFTISLNNALLATGMCQSYLVDNSTCAVDEQGVYCDNNGQDLFSYASTASTNCHDTSVCDPLCISTLNNITNTLSCCFFAQNNDTDVVSDWLSYEFWQRCGLTLPEPCEYRFDNSPNRISAGSHTTPPTPISSTGQTSISTTTESVSDTSTDDAHVYTINPITGTFLPGMLRNATPIFSVTFTTSRFPTSHSVTLVPHKMTIYGAGVVFMLYWSLL